MMYMGPNLDISLRPVTIRDLDWLYSWRNDPDIYQWFREQDGELAWSDHVAWFRSRTGERDDLVIEYLGEPTGVVSISADRDVGVYVGEKRLWGEGIASRALQKALADRWGTFTAEIHVENEPSQRVFESIGFEQTGRDGSWLQYRIDCS